jgi:hypothetical protein
MHNVRVAIAGLSPLCEQILRAALVRRPEIQVITPWTRLASLDANIGPETSEMLICELEGRSLPKALRALLAAAPRLRIVALSDDARSATVFAVTEQQMVLSDCSAEELWSAVAG